MRRLIRFAVLAAVVGWGSSLQAQSITNPNERLAPWRKHPSDKEGIWHLDIKFKDPRTITVDIPGRGKTTCWYLWYEITNRTGVPRYCHPTFEFVTLDRQVMTFVDEVLPTVQTAIAKVEDPTGQLVVHNSVSIGREPIPAAKPDAYAPPVYGVAIWPDVAKKAGDMTRFSIFISGLSDGWSVDEPKTKEGQQGEPKNEDAKKDEAGRIVRRKTMQLNFMRFADATHQDGMDVRFVTPNEPVYRSTSVQAPKKP